MSLLQLIFVFTLQWPPLSRTSCTQDFLGQEGSSLPSTANSQRETQNYPESPTLRSTGPEAPVKACSYCSSANVSSQGSIGYPSFGDTQFPGMVFFVPFSPGLKFSQLCKIKVVKPPLLYSTLCEFLVFSYDYVGFR